MRWSAQDYVLKRFSPSPLALRYQYCRALCLCTYTLTHTHAVYQHKDQIWIYLTIALADQTQTLGNKNSSHRGHKICKGIKRDRGKNPYVLKYGQTKCPFGQQPEYKVRKQCTNRVVNIENEYSTSRFKNLYLSHTQLYTV